MAAKRPRSPFRPKAPPRPATARQSDALEAVRELTASLGHAPSAGEIAKRLGITRWGVRKLLKALAAKGLVHDVPKVVSSGQWAVTGDE